MRGYQSFPNPPKQPSVLSVLRKASSKVQGSSLPGDLVPVTRGAYVSLGTAIKDNVLFARLDFIFCRILSPPKSLREQLPGNARDRFVSFVHFFFYCLVGNKGPETEREHSWGLRSPCGGRSPGQTSLYHCRCPFSGGVGVGIVVQFVSQCLVWCLCSLLPER